MIWIVFPGGGFGTTLEYAIHQFSKEFQKLHIEIHQNGSMHHYHKECHPLSEKALQTIPPNVKIVTPVYPNFSYSTVAETIENIKKYIHPMDSVIFVYSDNDKAVERSDVFVFYKVAVDNKQFKNSLENIQQWNPRYTSFDDMQPWEKREFISYRYQTIVPQHADIKSLIEPNWLLMTTDELLNDIEMGIKKVLGFLQLHVDDTGLSKFAQDWRQKQQYMLDDIATSEQIVAHVLSGSNFDWNRLNLQIEALIQYRLRTHGFEMQCDGLNEFPTNSLELKALMI
jgi:hypothetical protein